jgi:hypothetical protein
VENADLRASVSNFHFLVRFLLNLISLTWARRRLNGTSFAVLRFFVFLFVLGRAKLAMMQEQRAQDADLGASISHFNFVV